MSAVLGTGRSPQTCVVARSFPRGPKTDRQMQIEFVRQTSEDTNFKLAVGDKKHVALQRSVAFCVNSTESRGFEVSVQQARLCPSQSRIDPTEKQNGPVRETFLMLELSNTSPWDAEERPLLNV